ncbi:MAG: NDP-sugar synthase [Candidatus Micrarchaeia archaeon]
MKAIVLAGGYATRLQPLSSRVPKLLLPVAGKPVVHHLAEMFKAAGVTEIVFSLNETQRAIERELGSELMGMRLSYIFEGTRSEEEKLGAVGAIQYVAERTRIDSDCLVVGSDNFVHGLDLRRMVREHSERAPYATIALFDLEDPRDVEHFGVALLDERRITRFQEKPRQAEAVSKLASTAIYHVSPAFFERIPFFVKEKKAAGLKADKPGDYWEHLVSAGEQIEGFVFNGAWGDIGNPETYVETNKRALALPEFKAGRVSPSARVEAGAVVRGACVIDEGVVIESGAVVGPFVHLMAGCRVGAGACVESSILFEGCVVEAKASVLDSVIDRNCVLGESSSVEGYSLLGEECVIGEGARVFGKSRVWPRMELDAKATLAGSVRTRS